MSCVYECEQVFAGELNISCTRILDNLLREKQNGGAWGKCTCKLMGGNSKLLDIMSVVARMMVRVVEEPLRL